MVLAKAALHTGRALGTTRAVGCATNKLDT